MEFGSTSEVTLTVQLVEFQHPIAFPWTSVSLAVVEIASLGSRPVSLGLRVPRGIGDIHASMIRAVAVDTPPTVAIHDRHASYVGGECNECA